MNNSLILQQDTAPAIVRLVVDGLASEHSRRAYGRAIADFLDWHGEQGRPKLTKALVQRYKRELLGRDLAPATVNLALSAIRRLAREAADGDMLPDHQAAAIGRIKGVKNEVLPTGRALSAGEINAIFGTCGKDHAGRRDRAILALLRLGLRRAEVAGLERGDLDLDGEEIRVKGKGRKERSIPLANGALAALEAWAKVRGDRPGPLFWQIRKGGRLQRGKGITAQAVYIVLEKRRQLAGVAACSPHDWRRSFVGDLLDAGADLVTVQKLAGHADPATTSRYDRRPEEAKRRAVDLLHVPTA